MSKNLLKNSVKTKFSIPSNCLSKQGRHSSVKRTSESILRNSDSMNKVNFPCTNKFLKINSYDTEKQPNIAKQNLQF